MNWHLLQKYLSKECSPKERKKVEVWIKADEQNREFMKSLQKIWEVEPQDEIKVDAQAAWNSFRHKLTIEDRQNRNKNQKLHNSIYFNRKFSWGKAAVVGAAAAILIAFLYVYVPHSSTHNQLADNGQEMERITTQRGQRTVVRLSDGTKVHLNAASMIKIPSDYGDSTRDVYLEGEAFFEVTHNPQKPFLVHTPNAYTKVLGTKFDVKAYPGDDPVQVVVKEGLVALNSSINPNTTHNKIARNHMGTLDRKGNMKISEVQIDSYLGWKDGRLIFKSTPLKNMVPQLERWYDININVADSSLYSQRMTASFKDEPTSEVLKIIALSLNASYERKGRTVTFHAN
ncbi:MAG TPA: FecR domain-containing protein [Balneolaceae bacterium]|nr:FecR domain-containing protein [Balneolaceae bacterium]